jgi:dTDP-4-dehydrorhamnose reductase
MIDEKILIVGSTGMLGNTLLRYFEGLNYKVKTLNRFQIDLSKCSYSELDDKIKNSDCDIVINCAGIIKHRKNINTSDFIAVNSLFPHRIASICENQNIKMIHITTDCVFSGKEGNYTEDCLHEVLDDYGRSKSMGEPKNCTTIRTSIIGEEKSNKLSLLEWVKSNEGKTVDGYENHYWSGVTCLQLGKVINKIIKDNQFWQGVRHVFSPHVNKSQLINMIDEIYELNITLKSIKTNPSVNRTLLTKYNNIDTPGDYHVGLIKSIPNVYKQIKETKEFHDDLRHKEYLKYNDNIL